MKPTLFATAIAITLLTTSTSSADVLKRYFIELGRNLGYGISDGYHADRDCLSASKGCDDCSAAQHPMMHQPLAPQPMMYQPTMAPEYSQTPPPQFQQEPQFQQGPRFQQVQYPAGYYVAPAYQPQYQPLAPTFVQPTMPSFAPPARRPASLW